MEAKRKAALENVAAKWIGKGSKKLVENVFSEWRLQRPAAGPPRCTVSASHVECAGIYRDSGKIMTSEQNRVKISAKTNIFTTNIY